MATQDDIKSIELARWNDNRKRNERKKNESLTLILRHRKSGSRALILPSEEFSRPWMWDMEIPGPIPHDVFNLGCNDNLLTIFFNFPNCDDS